MKPRHAAALALVIWYLMIPPTRGAPAKILYHAPLSQWEIADQYDSKDQCEKAIPSDRDVQEMMKQCSNCSNGPYAVMVGRVANGQCVVADDLRIKKK